MNPEQISWQDFAKVKMHIGTIVDAEPFKEARQPAYKLQIDFGSELGIKKSSAQITQLYSPQELIGKQVVAVVNFPKKQIANLMSECLVLGAVDSSSKGNEVTLLTPDKPCSNGLKIS